MKGLWKIKVRGYKKDSKRKKTRFKHIIKDNKTVIRRRGDKLPFVTDEFYLEKIFENKELIPPLIPFYKLRVFDKYGVLKARLMTYKKGYYWNMKYIEIGSNFFSDKDINDYTIVENEVGKIINPDYKKGTTNKNYEDVKIKEYLYKKPLPYVIYQGNIKPSKNKQDYKKMAHKTTRANVRNYVKIGNFEKEIKVKGIEKSIAWHID